MRSQVESAAKTIENQARKLGYEVEAEHAGTGTVYLTLFHSSWSPCVCETEEDREFCECSRLEYRVVRIADHEPNYARYVFHVNRKPDLFVEPGRQVQAVQRLAEWLGINLATVPYLKAAATRAAKKQSQIEDREKRLEQERQEFAAEMDRRYQSCSDEDRRKADHYATLHGKHRKGYRRRHGDALRRAGAMA